MPITTADSIREHKGLMCWRCHKRKPITRWEEGQGHVCFDCDPKRDDAVIEPVTEDDEPGAEA